MPRQSETNQRENGITEKADRVMVVAPAHYSRADGEPRPVFDGLEENADIARIMRTVRIEHDYYVSLGNLKTASKGRALPAS